MSMTTNDTLLRAMPKEALLATARNFVSPAIADKTPATIDDLVEALAKQASLYIQLIAALSIYMEENNG